MVVCVVEADALCGTGLQWGGSACIIRPGILCAFSMSAVWIPRLHHRFDIRGERGHVRYIGALPCAASRHNDPCDAAAVTNAVRVSDTNANGSAQTIWIGLEWDHAGSSRHSGYHAATQCQPFVCRSGHGSFVKVIALIHLVMGIVAIHTFVCCWRAN